MMMIEEWSKPDEIFSSDSCLIACGGFWQGEYFHVSFPESILNEKYHINILEMLAVLICLRLWSKCFRGKRIQVFCDNAAVCSVVNSGKAKCEILQNCLRELAFLTATAECEVRAVHLDSKSNRISDHLSRWYLSEYHKNQFFRLTESFVVHENIISEEMFDFINNW